MRKKGQLDCPRHKQRRVISMMLIQESEAIAGFAILDNLLLMRHHQ
jgi:hypothetical protein